MQVGRAPAARDADVDAIDGRACRWPIEHRAAPAAVVAAVLSVAVTR
jgi:hypothetical protein